MIKPKLILGDGLLGSELEKQTGWSYLSRKKVDKFDFTKPDTYELWLKYPYDVVINCIAHTDTYDTNRDKHWDINYKAVTDLVDMCNKYKKKLIHISTDYLYTGSDENATEDDIPVHNKTWYGYTKLLGDAHVQLKSDNYLIVRCGHKEYPFLYENAYDDVIGNFDYVGNIVPLIIDLVENDTNGIKNVGTELKSMYDLAKLSKPDVGRVKCDNKLMPKNVSMRIHK